MSHAARPTEGIDPTTFATAVASAVEQILAARGIASTRNNDEQFAISPALAQPNIFDYSSGIGANIFTKATEPLKTIFSVKAQTYAYY
jgi:hypothetical protein